MASRYLLLLFLIFIINSTTAYRPSRLSPFTSPSPAPSPLLSSPADSPLSPYSNTASPSTSPSPPLAPEAPPPYFYTDPAPTVSHGVCDAARLASMGLDISTFKYCNASLPFALRAKALVDGMTLEEKVGQLGDQTLGVARLGIPKYDWWSEALHGVSDVGHGTKFVNTSVTAATSFPTPISAAAAFNESLWKTIGQAVSTEARAMYNLGTAGLTFWSPNINVVRDPRWGRTLETPGEDPFVVGTYASNYVRGLQDVEGYENPEDLNSRPLKVAACCKHYAAYDVDNWFGMDRVHFNANVTEQDMLETFLAPFEMCVKDGDVSSVMCSYNRVNGIPTCADPKLLKQTIRDDWNLHGYIVSDCDSIDEMYTHHQWLHDTKEDAVSQAMKAGLDLDCGAYYTDNTQSAIMQGKIRESDIDRALNNLYVVLMRLGFFDGSPTLQSLGKSDVCSDEHIELATEAAREGIVLLKNDNNTLPLSLETYKTVAVVGPHANATDVMIGNYAGVPCRYVSPLDAISKICSTDVIFEPGCLDIACKNETTIFKAMQAAKKADVTVIFAGLDLSIEAEGFDRAHLDLPGYQAQMINQVAMVAKGPVILVLLTAGGVEVTFARDNPNVESIIWAGYPGEEGGNAIADVIFGKYNPGGRLPLTWHYTNYTSSIPMTSMQLRPIPELGYPGRTYKFFDGYSVFPFGSGLSYSTFDYTVPTSDRAVSVKLDQYQHCRDLNYTVGAYRPPCESVVIDDIDCKEEVGITVDVQNNGTMVGNHVILAYSQPPANIYGTHLKKVIGFKRVSIPAGGSVSVEFKFNVCKSFGIVDYTAYNVLPSGEHKIILDNGVQATAFPIHVYFNKNLEVA